MTGERRSLTVTLLVLSQSTQAMAVGATALFLVLIRGDVGLTFAQAGTLGSASSLTYAFMQLPSGYLADRFGARSLFVGGLLGVNATAALFAVLDDYTLMLIDQLASGVFRSLVFAPGMLLISAMFAPERRATALGLYIAGGFSSNVLLSAAGPLLVGPFGWRPLLLAFAAISTVVVLIFWRLTPAAERVPVAERVRLGELPGLLREPVMWVCGLIQFVRLGVAGAMAFWLVTVLIEDKHLSLRTAGLVAAVGALVTAPSNIVGGMLSDRLRRPVLVIGVSVSMLAISLAVLPLVDAVWAVVLVVAFQAVFVQVYFGPLFSVPITLLGTRTAGLTSGWSNFCANVGALTTTYALGRVRDATGSFDAGFYALSVACVVAGGATVVLGRIVRSAQPAEG